MRSLLVLLFTTALGLSAPAVAPAASATRPVSEILAPVILREALTNESCLVARADGTLENYAITKPASDSVSVLRSTDGGLTWSEPVIAFPLPGRAYYALQVLLASDGALHAVVHIAGEGVGGYRGRLYEVYHFSRRAGAATWSEGRKVVPGYVGSIRGFIQIQRSGRLLLAVGRANPARATPPQFGPDFGWNDTQVYFSDDQGATWQASPDVLSFELKARNTTRYGAIEPVLLELRDGRVWMLVRDRQGHLLQSFSADGARWSPLSATDFISSDSPAALLRLRDGRIVMVFNSCQNGTDPRSYAMGGREVLHAAISADDGQTWRGFREVFREVPGPLRGDRGTAYASLVENSAGKIIVVSGQGEGRRALFALDPRWLEATSARDELNASPLAWANYGGSGLHVITRDDGTRALALPFNQTAPQGALWNFPMTASGELRVRLQVPTAAADLRLSLTDHFNRIDDTQAATHAVFSLTASAIGLLNDDRPHDVVLRWSEVGGASLRHVVLHVECAGRSFGPFAAQRPARFGVNYFRVEISGASGDGQVLLSETSLQAR